MTEEFKTYLVWLWPVFWMKMGWKLEWGREAEVESYQRWGPPVSLTGEAEVDVRSTAGEAWPWLGSWQDEGTGRISGPHISQSQGNDGANDRVVGRSSWLRREGHFRLSSNIESEVRMTARQYGSGEYLEKFWWAFSSVRYHNNQKWIHILCYIIYHKAPKKCFSRIEADFPFLTIIAMPPSISVLFHFWHFYD